MSENLQHELRVALQRHQDRMELIKGDSKEKPYANHMKEQSKLLFEHEVKALVQPDVAASWQGNFEAALAAQKTLADRLRDDLKKADADDSFERGVGAALLSVALGQEGVTDATILKTMSLLATSGLCELDAEASPYGGGHRPR